MCRFAGECSVATSSWVERWLVRFTVFVSCLVRRDLSLLGWVHSLVGVSWNGRGGCWWAVGTLLGPERAGDAASFGVLLSVFFLGPSLVSVPLWCLWVLCVGAGGCWGLAGRVGGGFGCCLRTAQWTRASLWLSF
jgi:hypothetical protein